MEAIYLYLTILGGIVVVWFLLVVLFAPGIQYHIERPLDASSEHFVRVVESSCQTRLQAGHKVEVFTDGTRFYPAMIEAIRHARESVNLECYMFQPGQAGDLFTEALTERARAGVRVQLVWDTIGTFGGYHKCSKPLIAAGCRVELYQRIRWFNLARWNNRTHRELLIVDGRVAFVGGAGIADWWITSTHGKPMWRDMMARIEGPIVPDLQGIFAEHWLECSGEILIGQDTYKAKTAAGPTYAFAIKSSPTDRASVSRLLFQTLVESAQRHVRVSTPYFLPDRAFCQALIRTVQRGVEVVVMVPGPITDQLWLRLASRRVYRKLLDGGVRIFEYQPGMTHVKAMVVDDLWAVIGTTNFDNRSFEHNDEDNVAMRDEDVALRLTEDFMADLGRCTEVTLETWLGRPAWEKLAGSVAWILERQQ